MLIEDGRVVGVATGDMGIAQDGEPGPNFQRGMELRAAYTIFAEGCRGSLTKRLIERFDLRDGCDPQTYALGMQGTVGGRRRRRTSPAWSSTPIGWPLIAATYGGSFVYHWGDNAGVLRLRRRARLPQSVALAVRGDAAVQDASRDARAFRGRAAHRLRRARAERGRLQSLPKLTFPGGCLVGDTAGFLNVPKIKGTHTAMKSGMLAAEAVAEALAGGRAAEPASYEEQLQRELAERRAASRCATSAPASRSSGCGAG